MARTIESVAIDLSVHYERRRELANQVKVTRAAVAAAEEARQEALEALDEQDAFIEGIKDHLCSCCRRSAHDGTLDARTGERGYRG